MASGYSGLLLELFLVVHLAGLLPALIAPVQFEHYATALHHQPWLPVLIASCHNASASLFVAAKLAHLGQLPQGQPERASSTEAMQRQMEAGLWHGSNLECRRSVPRRFPPTGSTGCTGNAEAEK